MNAVEMWGEMVRVEHEQSDRMRGVRPSDHWTQYAHQFKDNPHRQGDAVVEALRAHLRPEDTLLDVGAGGGRLALPLAQSCRSVTAVEPSPSMCAVLRETADEYGIKNVSVSDTGWLEAAVEPADVALCSHVVYVIEDIGAFVRKLEKHARRLVLCVKSTGCGSRSTASRASCPACRSLPVLAELGIRPVVTEMEGQPPRGFDSLEEAREMITRRLYVTPGTEAMARLERALDDSLHEENGVWQVRGTQPPRPCVVAWEPAGD